MRVVSTIVPCVKFIPFTLKIEVMTRTELLALKRIFDWYQAKATYPEYEQIARQINNYLKKIENDGSSKEHSND